MAEQLPVQKQEGMSRGCMVSLIVVGVIVVLLIVAGIVCYMYRDDLIKTGTTQALNSIKSEVGENPPAGLDTAKFNAVTDSFVGRLNADTAALNMTQLQGLMTTIQNALEDQAIDSSEAIDLQDAMFRFYPALGDEFDLTREYSEPVDSMVDTTGM